MDALKVIFILCLVQGLIMPETVRCRGYYSKTKPAHLKKEKVTHLRFFLHDILSGKSPSAVRIAAGNLTAAAKDSPTPFSTLYVIDDDVTVGRKANSKVVGNARGMYVSSSRDMRQFTLVMYMDVGFTEGKFNGSSLSVFSRNPVAEFAHERELAVVGGRGKFRMARGFIKVKTAYVNMKNGDAILEYKATIFHY